MQALSSAQSSQNNVIPVVPHSSAEDPGISHLSQNPSNVNNDLVVNNNTSENVNSPMSNAIVPYPSTSHDISPVSLPNLGSTASSHSTPVVPAIVGSSRRVKSSKNNSKALTVVSHRYNLRRRPQQSYVEVEDDSE